jgi:bla regulator protein blaR1
MRPSLPTVILRMALIGAVAIPLQSQTPAPSKPSFEVASVKPSVNAGNFIGIGRAPGGRFTANNVPLRFLIQNAYRVRDFQVIGGPSWIALERWDIEAKAEEGSIPAPTGPPDPNVADPMSIRLQSLLEDRFQLKLHRETRELPIYTLTIAKDGLKMKSVEAPPRPVPGQAPPGPPPPPPPPGGGLPVNFMPTPGSVMMSPGRLLGSAMTMTQLVNSIGGLLGRSVVDKTELKGYFDVRLQFAPDSASGGFGPVGPVPGGGPPIAGPPAGASDPTGPSIFTAVQEQLGLRLESTRGPVEVLIIDSVQKPTEN